MLTQAINDKIKELFDSTPEDVGVAYGFKIVGGEHTDEKAIVFHVKQKLPLDQIPEDQLLPSTIEIDGIVYNTDVFEVGEVKALSCPGCPPATCPTSVLNNCYSWQDPNTPPANRNTVRPLKGGLSIASGLIQGYVGTLGFIAVDSVTQALVGVSNNHVMVKNAFYTSDQNISGGLEGELCDPTFQSGEIQPSAANLSIGRIIRYVPMVRSGPNYLDAALCSVDPEVIDFEESYKQFGLHYEDPMEFATTEEIDDLLTTDPELYSSGRTSGVKGPGPCRLRTFSVGSNINVSGFHYQGNWTSLFFFVPFSDVIGFTRYSTNCDFPIAGGDSGSALIADFNGTWKIIGLVFAGGNTVGYACRIDRLATALNIEAWDGTPKNFINPTSVEYKTVPGGSSNISIDCGGETYWQIGFTNVINNPC